MDRAALTAAIWHNAGSARRFLASNRDARQREEPSAPCVSALEYAAMRPRHLEAIMRSIGKRFWLTCAIALFVFEAPQAATPRAPDWPQVETETLQHFQALLRLDTSNPPGNETRAVEYLKQVLEKEGIATQTLALEPDRANLVARIKGNGKKRPILIMGHTDVVTTAPEKWTFPPFGAVRDGGYIYGRGAVDDKDNVVAGLMVMLLLKRMNVPLDRDVIFLTESGEEGTTRVGIQHVVNQHFDKIDAEYCLAEGGGVRRIGGEVRYALVQTLEKVSRGIELTARGPSGHGSVPLKGNAVAHLSAAVASIAEWQPPARLNDTTRTYFERLAKISSPDLAPRYRSLLSEGGERDAAIAWMYDNEPSHAAMMRASLSPNIIKGGYRS